LSNCELLIRSNVESASEYHMNVEKRLENVCLVKQTT